MIETEVIVLKTVNYKETSLILHCLSPDQGRINFIARGVRKISKRQFPQIGLFRVLNVVASEPKDGDLCVLKKSEIETVNDHLALSPSLLDFSAAVSQLALKCSNRGTACPVFYNAVILSLKNIDKSDIPESAWISKILVSFLMEQGVFPSINLSTFQKAIIDTLLDKDYTLLETLNLQKDQWAELQKWVVDTTVFAGVELPLNPYF